MGFMQGKRALITGVASNRSIAWGIAEAMHREGAEIAFTYQNEKLKARVEKFAAQADSNIVLPCDVSSDEEIEKLFAELKTHWPDGLDIIVHSIAFADKAGLEGDFVEGVTRETFNQAHEISSYSFTALAKAGRPMLRENAALLTLSYLGAEKVITNYNLMGLAKASLEANVRYMASTMGPQGVRVNAVSAGPIRTLAASGISNFRKMLDASAAVTPMRRNVTIQEVGNTAAFLCSDLASGITGEITYVDGGYNTIGMAIGEVE
ncbi:enoyl-[acyl-carrier-protein] reductase [Solemya pervernicosa gill symbiont]|uniref:Enoyl-[acyl-carrier-protein] reductase [NADH] n=1 Tax=Solemya pervernicosa gill symbiont TaxID=642797 RepID=A0A1T2L0X9_9GAMM|nr:enoyl-ACP reductase [Solemya pervernicosa gill symbiont]OOZ38773.1 enoyl-[acyl-carrier-protein] reductase [Solemya pervernicosa gill symbiont]